MFSIIILSSNAHFSVKSEPRRTSGCGKQLVPRNSRVVSGNDSYAGEFPWTVSVRRNGDHHCGGVIIAKKWILTAAHCVHNRAPSSFLVRIGEFYLYHQDFHSRDYTVYKIIVHSDYSGIFKSQSINNADIALLKTRSDIRFNEYAWPVCVPSSDINFTEQEATVVGWGKKSEKSEAYSDVLQKARLSIIDNRVCRNWYRAAGRTIPIHENIICAGYQEG